MGIEEAIAKAGETAVAADEIVETARGNETAETEIAVIASARLREQRHRE